MTDTALQPPPLRLSRRFDAAPELVFLAFSTAEHVQRWFCPQNFSIPEALVEMRVGGRFEVCMLGEDGAQFWTRGRVAEIVPNRRLVLDLHAETTGGKRMFSALTEVTLSPDGAGTRMDVLQTYRLENPDDAWMTEGAPEGWGQTLDRLDVELLHIKG